MLMVEHVGIRNPFRLREELAAVQASLPAGGWSDPSTFPIATPWSSGDLQRVVFEDIFGSDVPENTRNAAMRLGPVAKSRHLVCTASARIPMRELEGDAPVADQPAWLTKTGDGTSPQLRKAWTADDLIFYGWSCWSRHYTDSRRRLEDEAARSRINQDEWVIDPDTMRVLVNGVPQDPRDVILIPGLHEGILSFGVDVLADARALHRAVRSRILNPAAQIDLHQVDGEDLTDPEIDDLVDKYAARRQRTNGAVSYSSRHIQVNELGANADAQLMIEARNAAAVDLARIIGVNAGMIDATAPKASLNYETQTGRNQEFVDFDLAMYLTPIEARMSLDDVSAPGRRVAFDLADFTAPAPGPTGPSLED